MKIRALGQIGDRLLGLDSLANNIERANPRGPPVWPNESGQNLHCCRLACAIWSNQQADLARFSRERHATQPFLVAVAFYQVFDGDHFWNPILADWCARNFQNCEVNEARSSITLAPGNAARSWANLRSFSAGLSDRNAIAGKSRRNTPNRSSSR